MAVRARSASERRPADAALVDSPKVHFVAIESASQSVCRLPAGDVSALATPFVYAAARRLYNAKL